MKYVRVEYREDPWPGYHLDPEPYLRRLPELRDSLPPGAREFACEPHHFDFNGAPRSIKDLQVRRIERSDVGPAAEIVLDWSHYKRPEGVRLVYRGVQELLVRPDVDNPAELGDVLLDEVLPHESGCSHEFSLVSGSIFVVCADLQAMWDER